MLWSAFPLINKHWTYGMGASVSNPEERSDGAEWEQTLPRLQFTGRLKYAYDKWSAQMAASYLGDRNDDLKPTLPVNLSVQYQASKDTALTMRMENVLDREDIVSHGSSHYLAAPRAYYFGIKQNF